MRVLGLASYPIEAAATRYRLAQYVAPLRPHGIELVIAPFLDSQAFASLYERKAAVKNALALLKATAKRILDLAEMARADVLLVQREAMMFGPPFIEWCATHAFKRPMVLDLDDATYARYVSPTYGRLAAALKWFSKTDDLIEWASLVVCGNRAIEEYVAGKKRPTILIPTIVNTDIFRPAARKTGREVVIGWIGTHSTFPYLESIFPVLAKLARAYRFHLKVVGSGRRELKLPGVSVENRSWSLERELSDLQSFDIGLYPIVADAWALGKSGFKAIQYMSVGIPYVVTPVGVCAEIGEPGVTHFNATTEDEWYEALARLIEDEELRRRMGRAGREHALKHYSLLEHAARLAGALKSVR